MRSKFDEQLALLSRELTQMGALCEEVIALAAKSITTGDVAIAEKVAPLDGEIDRIILTGGLAHSKYVAAYITKKVSFIAPVEVMAGEFELEALAAGACRVLDGEEKAKDFSKLLEKA